MQEFFLLFIGAMFVNNIVLAQYLGNCPFIGTSKESGVAIGMGELWSSSLSWRQPLHGWYNGTFSSPSDWATFKH